MGMNRRVGVTGKVFWVGIRFRFRFVSSITFSKSRGCCGGVVFEGYMC